MPYFVVALEEKMAEEVSTAEALRKTLDVHYKDFALKPRLRMVAILVFWLQYVTNALKLVSL